jgi:hypothetical protein
MKKITIGGKPTAKNPTTTPDDWVSNRFVEDEPMKRLTIDILSVSVRTGTTFSGQWLPGDRLRRESVAYAESGK